jgi:hypothetical protein
MAIPASGESPEWDRTRLRDRLASATHGYRCETQNVSVAATSDDLALEEIVVRELKEGAAAIERAGFGNVATRFYRSPRTDHMMFEIGGRFSACPDREVYATVEIDPGRVGWRFEGTLWAYPDAHDHSDEVRALGSARVEKLESAQQHARIQATAAWVAVRDYLRGNCPEASLASLDVLEDR